MPDEIKKKESVVKCPRCGSEAKPDRNAKPSIAERAVFHCDQCNWSFEIFPEI